MAWWHLDTLNSNEFTMNIPQCTQEIFKYFWMKREETVGMWKKSHMSGKKKTSYYDNVKFLQKKGIGITRST